MMCRLMAFLFVLLLAGCASEPTYYYRLAAPEAQNTIAKAPVIDSHRVLRVSLPDYLSSANIAYQESDVAISLAQSNLWAEAPESALARLLINDLSIKVPQTLWQTHHTATGSPDTTLIVSLDQFNGRYDGRAVISGRWLLYDARQQLVAAHPINIEVMQQGDGYPALARALGEGAHQLAGQIADQLPSIVVPQ